MKRWLLAAVAAVVVLGLVIGGLWMFLTTPADSVAEKDTSSQNRDTPGIVTTPDRSATPKGPVVCRADEPKVTDLSGDVGCPPALDIAERYRAAIANGQAQGQGLFWESGEWSCSWPYEDGLAHVQVPQKCVRATDGLVVQLGDYQP